MYDFECFKYDWLVVCIEPITETKTVIVNDKELLQSFYDEHKNDIWIGFNSRSYDQYILKGILCGFDPYKITDWIINKDKKGYQFSSLLNKIPLYNYDVFKGKTDYGLKTLECFMGNNIKETDVPFNIDRKLNAKEIEQTIFYCTHDVEQLIEVFLLRKDEFDTHLNMVNEFNLGLSVIGKTTAQLISIILGAQRPAKDRKDDYDIKLPDTLKLSKYQYVADWFLSSYEATISELEKDYEGAKKIVAAGVGSKKVLKDMKALVDGYEYEYDKTFAKYFYGRNLITEVAGVEHTYAWGGVHAAIPQFNYVCKPDELMIMADVASLYPSLDIQYDLQSRNIKDKSIYVGIYDTNLEMKRNHNPRRPLYKLICNTTYGCKGDQYNNLYDKRNQNLTCVFGQVLLTDLIEKLEPYCKLIQSNTDGILILIKRKDFDKVDDIVYEWEQRTRLNMEFTCAKRVYQKDVNNYIMVTADDHIKTKGAYVKKLDKLDYDLPIVNKAMIEFMVHDTPVEDTINNCTELIMFQKVFKLSSSYKEVWHNGEFTTDKCYRVFASKNKNDTYLGKTKNVSTANANERVNEVLDTRVCDYDNGGGWCTNKNSKYYDKKCPFYGALNKLRQCESYKEHYYFPSHYNIATIEKFANSPKHCFIWNDSVTDVKVPSYLDKSWYINLALERLKQFGVIE